MAITRNQHYVPQFLLRQFAYGASRRRIRLYRIERGQRVDGASVRGQCARHNFYGAGGATERALAKLEGHASAVIHRLVAGGDVPEPFTDDFEALIAFLAFQSGRTPAAINRLNEQLTHHVRAHALGHPGLPAELRSHVAQLRATHPSALDFALLMAARGTVLLQDMRLKLLKNETATEFILGDAAVVLHNQWCRGITQAGSIGLISSGLLVFLPISPAYTLLLFDTDIYRVGSSAEDIVVVQDEEEVRRLNGLQYAAASANVYFQEPAMELEIAAFPECYRETRGVRSARYRGSGGKADRDTYSEFVTVHHIPFNVDIKWGAIELRDEVRLVRPQERVMRWRPEAEAIAKAEDPHRGRSRPPLHQVYRRIDKS